MMKTQPSTPPGLARRILSSPPARVLMLGFILVVMMSLNSDVMTSYAAQPVKAVLHIIALAIAGFAVYLGYAHFIEQRDASELALPGMGRELGFGLLIGAGLYAACELILMALGIYRVEGLNPLSYMVPAIAMAVSSSVFEELLFRGVLFGSVETWFGSWAALVVSSLVFGLTHLINPHGHDPGRAVHRRRGRHFAGRGLHADAPAVAEHRLPYGVELHAVGHFLGHCVRQRCLSRA
jgi:membrane protease YdiL (CAAX protease family)